MSINERLFKFSVITPSFNQGKYIEQTIQSVLAQEYSNFEHIVIDGGSTDATVSILQKYSHLNWVSEIDRGQANAVNKGLRIATGDIIAWINSDDWYETSAFKAVAEFFYENPDKNVVMGNCNLVDEAGYVFDTVINYERGFDELKQFWTGLSIPTQPSIFFRKKLLDEFGSLDECLYYAMDYDLWLRFAQKNRFHNLYRVVANYRFHSEAKGGNQDWSKFTPEWRLVSKRYTNTTKAASVGCEDLPKVSVIMAVYNGERYLAEAIESIQNQTFRDFEFIIINDASTDNTKYILEKYMQGDDRMLLLSNSENLERAESRNKGVKIAKGEYVSIIDSDDISLPDKLERQVRFLDEYIDIGFVGTSHFVIDENGNEQYLSFAPNSNLKEVVHFMCNPSILARRDYLEKVGGYRSVLVPAEDYDLWLRVADICKAANISEPLFKYRVHAFSSTSSQKSQMDVGTSLALEMAEERSITGHDTLSRVSQQEAEQMLVKKFKASWLGKRRMLSRNFLTWSKAAYVLGEYNKSGTLALNALTYYPSNQQAICVVLKVIVRRLFLIAHELLQYFFSKTYCNSRWVRSTYWNKRAADIDGKWGSGDADNKVLADIIISFSPERLLDIGCGSGRLFPLYDQLHIPEIVGQDISGEALRIATKRYRFTNIITTNRDILSLEYPEGYFDLIVSNRVLQHLEVTEVRQVIEKLASLGKKLYLNELTDSDGLDETFYMFRHDYRSLFKQYGFVLAMSGRIDKQTWYLFTKLSQCSE